MPKAKSALGSGTVEIMSITTCVRGRAKLNWIAMRGALTGDVGKVHGNYHVPISNTASALLVLENRTHALETTYRKAS